MRHRGSMRARLVVCGLFAAAAMACLWAGAMDVLAAPRGGRSTWANRNLPKPQQTFEENFATSLVCANCHSNAPEAKNLRDDKGNGVAPFDLWQGTMMANATRDPFWRAVVSAEVAAFPARKAAIEADCMQCHAPMAVTQSHLRKEATPLLDVLYGKGLLTDLAMDGVSCTACHQISADGLGTPASYSGGFKITSVKRIYGPHRNPQGGPMIGFTGYTPTYATHISESKLCATCHTLFTEGRHADGRPSGRHLAEQTPYLEWRNSVFSTEAAKRAPEAANCQGCHMPRNSEEGIPIKTRLARTPDGGDFRTPLRLQLSRHIFVGGNTLVPQMLRDNRDEMGALASDEAFNNVIRLAKQQLATNTATVEVTGLQRQGGKLTFTAKVENKVGHKFPTAYPSRRAWLRVRVIDAAGRVVWAGGDFDDRGRILGADGKPLASESSGSMEPHRNRIQNPGEVQIWEAVMADTDGNPTWSLLRGVDYIKDNRLLPKGWVAEGPDAHDTEPRGLGSDSDFAGGSDSVTFELAVPQEGALTLEVQVVYQSLSWRYASELLKARTPEVVTFGEYLNKADTAPSPVAATKHELP